MSGEGSKLGDVEPTEVKEGDFYFFVCGLVETDRD